MTQIFRKRGIDTSNFEGKAEFVAKVHEVLELARNKFPTFDLANDELPIVFFNTGANAGMARWRHIGLKREYNIEFNTVAIKSAREDMINDTIPHEIAHIVDVHIHGRSHNHGIKWKRIANALGCAGGRTHNYDMSEGRRTRRRAVYVATCGTEIKLSIAMHNKIQRGNDRYLRNTGGNLGKRQFTGKIITA